MNLGGTIRLNRVGICLIVGVCLLLLFYMNSHGVGLGSSKTNKLVDIDKNTNEINLRKLLIASIEIAVKGGKEVILVRSQPNLQEQSKGKTKEGANDPVTLADVRSHCVMYYSLKHTFPKLRVISEEKAAEKDCTTLPLLDLDASVLHLAEPLGDMIVPVEDVSVWIDPLDATQEYTENLLQYVTTMVCVAVKGVPIIGVIHKPFASKPTSWAWVKRASSEDLQAKKPEEGALKIIVSRSHAGEAINVSKQLIGPAVEVIQAGGAGYKALEVAAGNVSAYVHITAIKKWDICAGNAILKALGGDMTTLANEQIDYSTGDNPVNTNGVLGTLYKHSYYIEKLSKYKPA